MTHRMFAVFAALLFIASSVSAQEKENSVSPSDIPVDQIKNASQKKDAPPATAQEPAAEKPAAQEATKPAPKPAAEAPAPQPTPETGSAVVAGCGCSTATSCCQPDPCDPCARPRGRLLSRLRSMMSRRCCQ